MDPPWMDELFNNFRDQLMELFSFLDRATIPHSHMPEMVASYLAPIENAIRSYFAGEITSERYRDSIYTYIPPLSGRSDAATDISHSSDSMGIRLSSEMGPAEREEQRLLFKILNDPSKPERMKRLKEIINAYKESFIARLRSYDQSHEMVRSLEVSNLPTSAEQSDAGIPESSRRQTTEEQSDARMPGSSKRQTSEEQSDAGMPGSSKSETSGARETSASGNFFQQKRLRSTEPRARVDDRAERTSHPLEEERLVDSLEHTSRSKPLPGRKPEAREHGREISSERWRGPIQRVESAESPQSPSLRPDSQPPLEVSVSSNLQISTPELLRAEWIEQNRRSTQRSQKLPEEFLEECRILGEAVEDDEARSEETKRHQERHELVDSLGARTPALPARFGPTPSTATEPAKQKGTKQLDPKDQPGTSGLRRSSRLMAQKRKTQIPESEGSNPKAARQESDSDTDSE